MTDGENFVIQPREGSDADPLRGPWRQLALAGLARFEAAKRKDPTAIRLAAEMYGNISVTMPAGMTRVEQVEQGFDHIVAAGMTAVGAVLAMVDGLVRRKYGDAEADELLNAIRHSLERDQPN